MAHIPAAMSEITRVAWWSLRALGCPIGAVERMAMILIVSEVLEGGSLQALRLNEKRLIESFQSDEPRLTRANGHSGIVDAAGRTLLDVGSRVIDLLCGISKTSGTARIEVHNASDLLGLSGACALAAKRGVSVLSITADSLAPAQLKWALYANIQSGVQVLSGSASDGEAHIIEMLRKLANPSLADLPPAPQPIHIDSALCSVSLIGFAPVEHFDFETASAPVTPAPGPAAWHLSNVSEAIRDAYANGLQLDAGDLQFLYELETRTWAPSSERSRMQAGFIARAAQAPTIAPH